MYFLNDKILNALCEYHHRCPICFGYMDIMNCKNCKEYYSECTCTPLTPQQILQYDYGDEIPIIKGVTLNE